MPYTVTKKIYYSPLRKTAMPSKPLLLSKAIEGFMLACRARRLSEHTLKDYSKTMRRLLAHVGDIPIQEIKPEQIRAFLVSQPGKEKTILNHYISLGALWTWAVKDGYTDRHIMRQVDKPKPQKPVIQPFTETEIKAMLSSVKRHEDRDRSLILLLLDTGARSTEICNLKIDDIDLSRRRIKVLGKGNKERFIPFSARTGSALFRYLATQDNAEHLYPFSRNSLADLIRNIGTRAGVKNAHPHRFRHTFATMAIKNGMDIYTLQEILGHSTLEMVREYLTIAQVDIDEGHRRASPVENWKL